ncbi:PREDICTED: ribonuclease 4 [Myotis davidii]|uniref:Ribonuclease 4 n=1 Tax=Myotis davidii TaxID=225400 RepID=L5LE95_MYODS|nr:PREDICTED: ribonuclease 4 [Myotis davidii]ELK24502.1 Ribonuclease 4 [Myotis davidii]
MALQKTLSLLLLSLLTLLGLRLGLGLVQPSYGQATYQRFLRQHVDSTWPGGNNWYCNKMMKSWRMTRPRCKQFHTFINEDIGTIKNICNTTNIQCRNGRMNCHAAVVRVTDCRLTTRSKQNCKYQGKSRSRRVGVACKGNPMLPVMLDT